MAFIDQSEINKIRDSVNIVDIISKYVPLTQKGRNYFGVCPFHEDHSPSMSVSGEKQIYKCFSCGATGNVFTFIQDYENISFVEAVIQVGKTVGVTLENVKTSQEVTKYQKEYEILNLANKYYQNNLKTADGIVAKEYLQQRGIDEKIINEFEFGLASDKKNEVTTFMLKKGYEKSTLNQIGLSYEDNDVFYKRIMFPLHDATGKTVAFSGRIYQNSDTAKYVNSKESNIFKKGNILYNYHRAKEHVRLNKQIILVEGYMDTIRLAVNGIKNVCAIMGTSLTNEQTELLKKLRVPIILCLDNDTAGKTATKNIGDALIKKGLEVFVISLSGEKDPDEYIIKNGIEAFKDNLKKPLNFFDYNLEYLKSNKNLQKSEELAEYINQVIASLKDIDDEILKDITIKKLSSEYDVDIGIIKKRLANMTNKVEVKKEDFNKEKTYKRKRSYEIAAEKIIYYMINDSKYIKVFQKQLGYFENPLYRDIVHDIIYYYKINKTINLADFISYIHNKENIYEKTKEIIANSEEKITDILFDEYIKVIKRAIRLKEIEEIKKELRNELDENKKIDLLNRLTEIKKEV